MVSAHACTPQHLVGVMVSLNVECWGLLEEPLGLGGQLGAYVELKALLEFAHHLCVLGLQVRHALVARGRKRARPRRELPQHRV